MTEGFVDSASAYEIILALARPKPTDAYRMEWDRALEVTATLINTDHIKLAPSPKPEGPASGPYGIFLEGLENAISRITLGDAARLAALSKTKDWANRNPDRLRSVLTSFIDSSSASVTNQAPHWLESHISGEWAEHVLRHGALFDREFIPQIAKVLRVAPGEIETIWARSGDPFLVAELIRCRPENDEFHLIRDAFVVSTLLRGRYHEYAAEEDRYQIMSHPVRRPVLKRSPLWARVQIDISNTERYLANVVLASAFSERKHDKRVAQWVQNVATLRKARKEINLEPKDRDETARDVAIEAAKRFDIAPRYKMLENVVDAGIWLGSTALTSFGLAPWESMVVGGTMYVLSARKKIGGQLVSPFSSRRGRLRKLSQLNAGRIEEGTPRI
jgi:hypothetical protein